jgi:signal transduction histidine kinase
MKTLIFVFLLSMTCGLSFSQSGGEIDSLQLISANSKDDTNKINAQISLSMLYRLGNYDSSLMYGKLALENARHIHFVSGQISALGIMSIVAGQQGNLPGSLELGFEALQLADDHHLESFIGLALDGIAKVYFILEDYAEAIKYWRKLALNHVYNIGRPYAYMGIGNGFYELNQLDSANFYAERSIDEFDSLNYEEPLVYQLVGNIKIKSGRSSDALNYYRKSLQISLRKNIHRASTQAYCKIAALFKNINEPDSAIFFAKKGLEESQLVAQKKTIYEAAALLSELYEPKDTRESLRYLKIADTYKDSLVGAGSIHAVQVLVAQQKEHQKEIHDAKAKYQAQLKQYVLVGGLAAVLIFAAIQYRNNRQKQLANKVLENTLNNLRSTQQQLIQQEKMASLGELTAGIAHEIQNPLNFINNFAQVNEEFIEEAEDAIKKGQPGEAMSILRNLKDNQEKINQHGQRADSIVKGMLQHSRSSSGQKEPTDINALIDEYSRLSYHGWRAKDNAINISLKKSFDPSINSISIVPQDMCRVILNLCNNAFYAVSEKKKIQPGEYEPTVEVSTAQMDHKVEIKIKDNGSGIPNAATKKIFQPFFTTKPAGQGTGLGLSLSYDIIKSIGGEIRVESKEAEGSIFTIVIPLSS